MTNRPLGGVIATQGPCPRPRKSTGASAARQWLTEAEPQFAGDQADRLTKLLNTL